MSAPRANEVYTRRLNDSLELMERNFRGLVEAARVDLSAGAGPSAEHDRDLMQIDLNTANIVRRPAPPRSAQPPSAHSPPPRSKRGRSCWRWRTSSSCRSSRTTSSGARPTLQAPPARSDDDKHDKGFNLGAEKRQ